MSSQPTGHGQIYSAVVHRLERSTVWLSPSMLKLRAGPRAASLTLYLTALRPVHTDRDRLHAVAVVCARRSSDETEALVPRGRLLPCPTLPVALLLVAQLKHLCLRLARLQHKHLLQPVSFRSLPQVRHQRLPACLRTLPAQRLHPCRLDSLTRAHRTARWW